MQRFCTRCGRPLAEGEVCNCPTPPTWQEQLRNKYEEVKEKALSYLPKNNKFTFLERGKKITPDCISPNEGEIPVRQYKLAKLRSRLRGSYAEGRLQVTDKRVIFRAAGYSSKGKTITQEEFSVGEIGGVEIKKNNRLSGINVFISLFLSAWISTDVGSFFEAMNQEFQFVALFLTSMLFFASVAAFVFMRKFAWFKYVLLSTTLAAVVGLSDIPADVFDIVFNFKLFSFSNIIIFVVAIGTFFTWLRVIAVPDLSFSFKTNGATETVTVKRRVWGTFFKQQQENSGFSEVLPWADTDRASEELGAMIRDLQIDRISAIEKWKQDL